MRSTSLALGSLSVLALAASAQAETALLTVASPPGAQGGFAYSIASAGDVNGDGYRDFAVGSIDSIFPVSTEKGRVDVISGKDKAVLRTYQGDQPGDYFGTSIANAGDVDADGFEDLVVGAPQYLDWLQSGFGYVVVYSGKTGAVIHKLFGGELGAMYGVVVGGAGDTDGDGHADFLVTAQWSDAGASNAGSAYLYSGATGGKLFDVHGASSLDYVGLGIAGVGDLDKDGKDDFAISAPGEDDPQPAYGGSVRVYSGATHAVLFTFTSSVAFAEDFGWSVADAGDVDQDGWHDIVVGGPGEGDPSFDGHVLVYSGRNGSVLHHFQAQPGDSLFGNCVKGAGDLNDDGYDDVLVGVPLAVGMYGAAGRVVAYSGKTGGVLFSRAAKSADAGAGFVLAALGDVNQDGLPEVAANFADKVQVLTFADLPASFDLYGAGYAGTNGVPGLTPSNNPVICEPITLTIGNSRGVATVATLFLGVLPLSAQTGYGGTLLVDPVVILPVAIPATGLPIPAIAACDTKLAGFTIYMQALELDPGAALGVSFTKGLKLVHGGN